MDLTSLGIDNDWTLFLDRDGVVNRKLEDAYVRHWDEYDFLPGVKEALQTLARVFGRIVIVTNQQGIGKGLMTEEQLADVHDRMRSVISDSGGRIDAIYHCPHLAGANCDCRKPRTGMVVRAIEDSHDIDSSRSVMVGDSEHDMDFGKRAGMYTVAVGPKLDADSPHTDLYVRDLAGVADLLKGSEL